MNKTILMGRLTREPEVRYSASDSGLAIARFTLAVNRRFHKDGEPAADFISCVAFGKNAEFIEKYIGKGRQICICGRIQTGSYTNKDGQKVYTTEVVVDEVEFADSKPTSAAGAEPAADSAPSPAVPTPQPSSEPAGFEVDEEIPFN